MKLFYNFIVVLILGLLLSGCGYKPVTKYSKNSLGKNSYIDVAANLNDPKNILIVKDEFIDLLSNKLKTKVTINKNLADNIFLADIDNIDFKPIQYDDFGYVTVYRVDLYLNTKYELKKINKKGEIRSYGYYTFSIDQNNVVSDLERFKAIKYSSYKAIDEFISKISLLGGVSE